MEQTGGVGKFSNALTLLADEALMSPDKEIFFFPERGFFASFNLLTGNRVPYEVILNSETIQKHAKSGRDIRLVFWQQESLDHYANILKAEVVSDLESRIFYQRDGKQAFHLISAHYPSWKAGQ